MRVRDFRLAVGVVLVMMGVAACSDGSSPADASSPTTPESTTIAAGSSSTTTEGTTLVQPVVFDTLPDARTQESFARFEFSSPSAGTYQCSLDAAPYADCASPQVVQALSAGEHELAVRTVAGSGDLSESRTASWTVVSIFGDAVDPQVDADLIRTAVQPAALADNSWRGIVRINCDLAHISYNDPIAFPGQNDAAHLHSFYGNTLIDANTTTVSLVTSGESSCQGNLLNRSSYWVPSLLAPSYDPVSGQRLLDMDGQPAWKVVPAVVGNDDEAHEIFYYSAGVDDLESIQSIPVGMKMIAGTASARPGSEQDTSIVRWHCQSWQSSDATNPRWSTSIPECEAPDRLRMDVFFPSCWNGTDLDSSDHQSHLAYPVSTGGPNGTQCPETHPVPIIRVSFHYAFGVKPDVFDPATRSSRGWRLASDMYEVGLATPGGISLHGDWFNAWHPEALEAMLAGCIREQLDCHDGNLANGYRLSGTRPGTQTQPSHIH